MTESGAYMFLSLESLSTLVDGEKGRRVGLYTPGGYGVSVNAVSDYVQCCSLRLQEVISTSQLGEKSETKKKQKTMQL